MQAGLLRDFIEIWRCQETKNPDSGEVIRAWSKIWRGRARVEFSSGARIVENNETTNTFTRKVTIRTKPAITDKLTDLQVRIGNEKFAILSRDTRDSDMATIMIVELINE